MNSLSRGVRALLKGDFIMAPTLCFRMSRLGGERFREGLKFVLDIQLTTNLLFAAVALGSGNWAGF